jgi:hypothetical protein
VLSLKATVPIRRMFIAQTLLGTPEIAFEVL